jgi:hypothetical protein
MTINNSKPISADNEQRLLALEQELAQLRRKVESRSAPSRFGFHRFSARALATGIAVAALLVTVGAVSQGTCPAGIPFCFQAGAVIRATEVNSNFSALATSLSGKLGVTAQGDVDIAGTLGVKIKTKTCSASTAGAAQCMCDAGELAIGGGASAPSGAFLATSRPKASERNTWEVSCRNSGGTDATCTDIRAVCVKMKAL